MVYAGNLLHGRIDTLKEIIKALREINLDGTKAVLEVYLSTPIDKEEICRWFEGTNAFYKGAMPYEELRSS